MTETLKVIPGWARNYPPVHLEYSGYSETEEYPYYEVPNYQTPHLVLDGGENSTHRVGNMTGWGASPVDTVEIRSPLVDGYTIQNFKLPAKEIAFTILMDGCSRSEYFMRRRQLIDFMTMSIPLGDQGYQFDSLGYLLGYGYNQHQLPKLVWEMDTRIPYHVTTYPGRETPILLLDPYGVPYEYGGGTLPPEVKRTYSVDFVLKDGLNFQPSVPFDADEWSAWTVNEPVVLEAPSGIIKREPIRKLSYDIHSDDVYKTFNYQGNYHTYPIITIRQFENGSLIPGPRVPGPRIELNNLYNYPAGRHTSDEAFQVDYIPSNNQILMFDGNPINRKIWLFSRHFGIQDRGYQEVDEYLVVGPGTESTDFKIRPIRRIGYSSGTSTVAPDIQQLRFINCNGLHIDIWFYETYSGI